MMQIALHGIGLVGGFGFGVDQLARQLEKVGCKLAVKGEEADSNPGTHFKADTEPLKRFTSPRQLRRIDHFSRLALLGAFLALEDAETSGTIPDRKRTGVVLATGYGATRTTFGFLDSVIDDGDALASPTYFANSVHNAAAAHVAMLTGAKGPNLTVSRFDASMGEGLLAACQMLKEKLVSTVLLGGVDEYCDVLEYCHEKMGCQTTTFPIGEGAVFFVLSCKNKSSTNGADPKYGWVTDVTKQASTQTTESLNTLSAVYGEIPIAPGFDLAIAALGLSNPKGFKSRGWIENLPSGIVINQSDPKYPSAIVRLKDWGYCTLNRAVGDGR